MPVEKVQPLGDVADLLSGGTPSKSAPTFWNGSIPWLTPKDMGNWTGATEETVSDSAIGNGTRLAPPEASFVAVRGMSLHNEIRIVRAKAPIAFNQDVKAVIPRAGIQPEYLFQVLISKKTQLLGLVEAAGHGTGRLPTDQLLALEVPRFAPEVETAIAEFVGALDDKIDLNRRIGNTLERMARAIFKSWFVDFDPVRAKMEGRDTGLAADVAALFPDGLGDDGLPEGWVPATLARLAVTNAESWTGNNHPQVIEYVDLSNTKLGNIENTVTFDWEAAPSRARRICKVGDTILGTTRPGNGSYAYISCNNLTVSTGFAVLSPHSVNYRDAVYLFATSPENIARLARLADGHGGAYPAVKPSDVADTGIIFPGDGVLAVFADLAAPLRGRIEHSKSEAQTLVSLRDLLLPKLMSGAIRIGDAEKLVGKLGA